MKIAACIILYHPEQSVEQHIITYINYVEKIYIIDNSESRNYNDKFLSRHASKIIFIYNGINEGIAKRLNQACVLAIKDGFEFLLTMDQDSYFEENYLNKYLTCIENFSEKEKAAVFGINYKIKFNNTGCNYNKVKTLITSGSIVNLKAYKIIGNFDEDLFIDFVDTDYCFKSILKGFQLIEFPNIFMHHEIGKISKLRSLKNLKPSNRSIHSAIRLYYMYRNFLYLNTKYKNDFKLELSIHKKDLINRIKNKFLYNNNRVQTIKFLLKASRDYKKKKMGKQV